MASEWQQKRFGECAVLVRGTVSPEELRGTNYIGLEHIGEGSLSLTSHGVASDVTSAKSRFKRGDILFGKLRPYFRKVLRAPFDGLCSTDIWVVRPRDGIDPAYLFYWMASEEFVDAATQGSDGTKMPRAQWEYVSKFTALVPPLPEQHAIGCILGALDDKIKLNQRMNETLEDMARALFKSWFIDFDPVHAKAESRDPGLPADTAALFPSSFEDSDLGEIPQGWMVAPIGHVAEVTIGGDWGEDTTFAGAVETVCLRGVDLEHLRENGWADAPRRWLTASSIEKRSSCTRDVLVAGSGAGPTGRSLWAAPELDQVWGLPVVYSNFCKRFRCASERLAVYLDRSLSIMRDSGEIWDYVNGTSVPNLDAGALLSGKMIVLPADPILDAFAKLIKKVSARLFSPESRTLATLRDILLPKLLSGELPVKDVDQAMEAHL